VRHALYSLQIRLIDMESSSIETQAFRDVTGIEEVLMVATQDVANQLAGITGAQVTEPAPTPPGGGTASLNVTSGPSGANVTVDGESKGTTPVVITLPPGSYEVVVELDGYRTETRTVPLTAGTQKTENFALTEVPSGTLNITSNPSGATILIDGNDRGRTPQSSLRVSTGQHRVEIRQNGYESYTQNVNVMRGRRTEISATLERSGQASIRLNSNFNGALVYIDGVQHSATTPVDNISLRPGPHTISVKARGYSSWEQTVNLQDGAQEVYTVSLQERSRFAALFLGAIPGMGHFYSGRSGMGTFLLLATGGAYAWAISQTGAMTEDEDLYLEKYDEYSRATAQSEVIRLRDEMLQLWDDWDAAQKSAQTAGMVAAAVHVFGALHSAVFMPRLRPVITSGGPTLSLKPGTRAGRATLTLSINF